MKMSYTNITSWLSQISNAFVSLVAYMHVCIYLYIYALYSTCMRFPFCGVFTGQSPHLSIDLLGPVLSLPVLHIRQLLAVLKRVQLTGRQGKTKKGYVGKPSRWVPNNEDISWSEPRVKSWGSRLKNVYEVLTPSELVVQHWYRLECHYNQRKKG